ncbi:MAG: hypothetical protein GY845_30350 [Planctomycetes bacterium]|nr:hypothetical protein [Planctomycetota bacterium]
MEKFFIVSLPRSRSTWLSHLLTTDYSHCFHELISYFGLADGLNMVPKPYVGSTETHPAKLYASGLLDENPVVVVERPVADVKKSILKAFDKPVEMPSREFERIVDGFLAKGQEYLEQIKKMPNSITIKYSQLDDNIEKLWAHCLPGVLLLEWRVSQFQDTIITVKNRDVSQHLIEIRKG